MMMMMMTMLRMKRFQVRQTLTTERLAFAFFLYESYNLIHLNVKRQLLEALKRGERIKTS